MHLIIIFLFFQTNKQKKKRKRGKHTVKNNTHLYKTSILINKELVFFGAHFLNLCVSQNTVIKKKIDNNIIQKYIYIYKRIPHLCRNKRKVKKV